MHAEQAKLPRRVAGSLNLDMCSRDSLPLDWDIIGVFGDILMCEYVDEAGDGEVLRGGIIVKADITTKLWRTVRILMKGPNATNQIEVGDVVVIPSDRGIRGISKEGKNIIFINEERIFCKVRAKKPADDLPG